MAIHDMVKQGWKRILSNCKGVGGVSGMLERTRRKKGELGRQARRWFSRILAGCLAFGAGYDHVEAAAKRAVVIGINRYEPAAKLRELKYATNDAQAMAKVLAQSGYRTQDIRVLTTDAANDADQPTKANILTALRDASHGDHVTSDDSLIVVIATHGFNDRGESYLCPSDYSAEAPNESAVRVAEIANMLASSTAGEKYVVIDACRSDRNHESTREFNLLTGLKRMRLDADKRPHRDGAARVAGDSGTNAQSNAPRRSGRGIVFFSSCLPGQASYEDSKVGENGGAGVFLHFFGQGLLGEADYDGGNHDGRVSAFEAIEYASAKTSHHVHVRFDAPQMPWADSHSTAALVMTELSSDARKRLFARFGHRIENGLKHAERLQAEAKLDAALGTLARGNNQATIELVSKAIEADDKYYMARRLRSVLWQIEGNNSPERAFSCYAKAVEDMRAVGGALRITLTKDVALQDERFARLEQVPAGSVLVVDEVKRMGGYEWVHVEGVLRGEFASGNANDAKSVNAFVWLGYIADRAANDAQIDSLNRAQGATNVGVSDGGGNGEALDRVQEGLTVTGAVLQRIPATGQAGSIIQRVNGGIGALRGW